jgi:hypothetical protein
MRQQVQSFYRRLIKQMEWSSNIISRNRTSTSNERTEPSPRGRAGPSSRRRVIESLFVPRPPLLQGRPLHLPRVDTLAELLVGILGHVAQTLHLDGLELDLQVQQLGVALLPLALTSPT